VTRDDETLKRQVNLPLEGRSVLVLQLLLAREQCSVPELLVPIVEEYLKQQLELDPDLGGALKALVASRSRTRGRKKDVVRSLPTAHPR
jgi:hypothetical protein